MKKMPKKKLFILVAILACTQALAEDEAVVKDRVSPEYKTFYKGVSEVLLEGISEKDVSRVVGGVVDDVINDVIDDVVTDVAEGVIDNVVTDVVDNTIDGVINDLIADVVDDVLLITKVGDVSSEQKEDISKSVRAGEIKISTIGSLAGDRVNAENISLKEQQERSEKEIGELFLKNDSLTEEVRSLTEEVKSLEVEKSALEVKNATLSAENNAFNDERDEFSKRESLLTEGENALVKAKEAFGSEKRMWWLNVVGSGVAGFSGFILLLIKLFYLKPELRLFSAQAGDKELDISWKNKKAEQGET